MRVQQVQISLFQSLTVEPERSLCFPSCYALPTSLLHLLWFLTNNHKRLQQIKRTTSFDFSFLNSDFKSANCLHKQLGLREKTDFLKKKRNSKWAFKIPNNFSCLWISVVSAPLFTPSPSCLEYASEKKKMLKTKTENRI